MGQSTSLDFLARISCHHFSLWMHCLLVTKKCDTWLGRGVSVELGAIYIYMFTIDCTIPLSFGFFLRFVRRSKASLSRSLGLVVKARLVMSLKRDDRGKLSRITKFHGMFFGIDPIFRIPQTNSVSLPLKMDGWKAWFRPIFQGQAVEFSRRVHPRKLK